MNCPHCNVRIDEHEAGRQTDACVAEVVMGMKRRVFEGQNDKSLWPDEAIFDAMEEAGVTHIRATGEHIQCPHYSTDISAAWEVVEKVNQDNAMTLRWYNPDGRTSLFSVAFGFGIKTEAEADTAPLAICRAAIKASQ